MRPTLLDAFDVETSQPLIWIVPLFAMFINSRRSSSSRCFESLASWHLLVGSHELKLVVVADVSHNQIKGGTLEGFIT
jgi:hypothetical protein